MKKNIHKVSVFLAGFLIAPAASLAALDGLKSLLTDFGQLVSQSIIIVFSLALLFFFWGIAQFVLHSGDAKVRDDGKNKIFWGVIAMFVMVSIYGIIYFIGNLFGIPTGLDSSGGGTFDVPLFMGDAIPGGSNT